jgi:ribosomal protein S18 acetylase RimI-like enzyme
VDDDQKIAGMCLCRAWGDTEPGLGWVEPLGVRSDWRKRGLGGALLRYGLHTMQAHGFTLGGLEVDSENRTNAVALYERAGMHVHKRYLIYRKAIRGPHEEIFKG